MQFNSGSAEKLTKHLEIEGRYFSKWRLQPKASKEKLLNNKLAKGKLNIKFEQTMLTHNETRKYLIVSTDQKLLRNHSAQEIWLRKPHLRLILCLIFASIAKITKHYSILATQPAGT